MLNQVYTPLGLQLSCNSEVKKHQKLMATQRNSAQLSCNSAHLICQKPLKTDGNSAQLRALHALRAATQLQLSAGKVLKTDGNSAQLSATQLQLSALTNKRLFAS